MNTQENRQPPPITTTEVLCYLICFLLGGAVAALATLLLTDSDEEKLRQYRAILIRHGAAEYRADTDGEPVFVILDRAAEK